MLICTLCGTAASCWNRVPSLTCSHTISPGKKVHSVFKYHSALTVILPPLSPVKKYSPSCLGHNYYTTPWPHVQWFFMKSHGLAADKYQQFSLLTLPQSWQLASASFFIMKWSMKVSPTTFNSSTYWQNVIQAFVSLVSCKSLHN